MPRTKSKVRKAEQFGYYLVEVTDWSFVYHIGIGDPRWDDDPISEHATVEVAGRLVGPTSSHCTTAKIALASTPRMAREARTAEGRERNRWVGFVEKRGDVLTGHVSLSEPALANLLPIFTADRIRMVLLHGPRLFRSKALVRWVSVETTLNIEDYPTDYS